jgi:hypothetical protein
MWAPLGLADGAAATAAVAGPRRCARRHTDRQTDELSLPQTLHLHVTRAVSFVAR